MLLFGIAGWEVYVTRRSRLNAIGGDACLPNGYDCCKPELDHAAVPMVVSPHPKSLMFRQLLDYAGLQGTANWF
jgi:hypothetical protein